MGGTRARIVMILLLGTMVTLLVPSGPAWACSCPEPTLEEFLEYEPDGAVARIRRIDTEGGGRGVGFVEAVLHGPELPEQIALDLDDGASCLPWLAVGDVAVLGLARDGSTWQTTECGRIDASAGLAEVAVDPAAHGPTAAVVLGRFPGADAIALDGHLRVRATAALGGVGWPAWPCGDDLLVLRYRDDGTSSVGLLSLANLEVEREHELSGPSDEHVEVLDARCTGDHVDVLSLQRGIDGWGAVSVVMDVFGAAEIAELGPAEDAAFAADDVLLLRSTYDADGQSLTLARRDLAAPASTSAQALFHLDGVAGYEVWVAPDAAHAVVRGFGEDSIVLVVDVATGAEVARSTGSWMPVRMPWLATDRFLQVDEDAGGIGDTGLASYRIADLDLEVVTELAPTPTWNATANDGAALIATAHGIRAIDGAGRAIRGVVAPWAAGAELGLVVGPLADGPDLEPVALPPVEPGLERAGASGGASRLLGVLAAGAVGAVAAIGLLRRRRHVGGHSAPADYDSPA